WLRVVLCGTRSPLQLCDALLEGCTLALGFSPAARQLIDALLEPLAFFGLGLFLFFIRSRVRCGSGLFGRGCCWFDGGLFRRLRVQPVLLECLETVEGHFGHTGALCGVLHRFSRWIWPGDLGRASAPGPNP